jgi:hypothetical protein
VKGEGLASAQAGGRYQRQNAAIPQPFGAHHQAAVRVGHEYADMCEHVIAEVVELDRAQILCADMGSAIR